jgi:anti-sigma factor RsiW
MRRVVDDPLTLALARVRRDGGGWGCGRLAEFSMPACEREVQVGPYFDGELSEADRREFEAHLAGCPECARQLAELQSLSRGFGRVRELKLPAAQRQRLLDLAEAVARGGTSPAADGPAFAHFSDGGSDAGEDEWHATDGREPNPNPNPMRIVPPDRSVRWVRWLTAAAAAVFLFSVIQLFLTHRWGSGESSDGTPGGIPAMEQTRPAPRRGPDTKESAVPAPAAQPTGGDSP